MLYNKITFDKGLCYVLVEKFDSDVSCFQALFMPYDHKNTTPEGLPSQKMRSLLEQVNKFHCQNRCMIGSGGGSVGFVSSLDFR